MPGESESPSRTLLAVAAVALVAVGVTAVVGCATDGGGSGDKPKAEGGALSSATEYVGQRAVLTAPGWQVSSVVEPGFDDAPDSGAIYYVKGPIDPVSQSEEYGFAIHWTRGKLGPPGSPAPLPKDWDRSDVVDLFGTPSQVLDYNQGYQTVMVTRPPEDGFALRVEGRDLSRSQFMELLPTVRSVNEAGFEAAMPDNVVTPSDRRAVISEMLTDVDVPGGFDRASIDLTGYDMRDSVAQSVAEAVGCAWVRQWRDAHDSGGDVQQEADDAMAASRKWDMLTEMDKTYGFAEGFWRDAQSLGQRETNVKRLIERFCGEVP